ncbi:hypothetical protein R1sor_014171 [Riccia sorocarpa]|uniref:Uncharacterized protein n=1 Tax=Riccia sorocarpa TaxID=122646 RepID=A0ABD3HB90_9MARC
MAAGHSSVLSRPIESSSTFCGSLFSSRKTNRKNVTRVELASGSTSCTALIASPRIEKEVSRIRVPHIDAPLPWSFQDFAFQHKEDNDAQENVVDVGRSKTNGKSRGKSLWETLKDDSDGRPTDVSSKLPWMDPSLQYANVMWFKGAWNAQIFVSPDESEDSLVRRFRHAVAGAGVLRECYRRRYRETPQDVIKRKQRQAALYRKKMRRYDSNHAHAYVTLSENSRNSKKTKKKKKEFRSQTGREAGKNAYDSEDDFWGYTEESDQR